MLYSVNFIYDAQSFSEGLDIMKKTVLRAMRRRSTIALGVFAGVFFFISVLFEEYIVAAFWAAAWVVCLAVTYIRKPDERLFIDANSPDGGDKYWSRERTLTIYDDRVDVFAEYDNPDELLSEKDMADADYMSYREEAREDMSHFVYKVKNTRCYESRTAFMLYRKLCETQVIAKACLSDGEVNELRARLSELYGERYITIDGQTR